MFRRYPYWGWLLLCILLWCLSGYYFHQRQTELSPEKMARAVNRDLQQKESIFSNFISDTRLTHRLFTDSLSDQEAERIDNFPFYIYTFINDTLKHWNTNSVLTGSSDTALNKAVILKNDRGVFVAKCLNITFNNNKNRLVVLYPIVTTYPLENDYLKSEFVASDYIPLKTKIITSQNPVSGGYPVKMKANTPVFYMVFSPEQIQKWIPDLFFIALLISSLIATMSWIQLMIIFLTRKSSWMGFFLTLLVIALFRSALYAYGLPFNLDTLLLFSPRLYASSKYLSSFGDLAINTTCLLWLVMFITRHTPYKNYFLFLQNKLLRKVAGLSLIVVLCAYVFLFVGVIRSLVLDSNISFDVGHFYSINGYTIMGLVVIGTITGISCIVIYLFNVQLSTLLNSKWVKYLLVAIVGAAFIFITQNENEAFYRWLLVWLLVFMALLDIPNFTLVSDLFEPHMIFWAVFICAFCTGVLQYFNHVKEHLIRTAFVEQRLTPHRDDLMEYAFDKTAYSIEQDKVLKAFLRKPSAAGRKSINQRFDAFYLQSVSGKYQPKVYLFDAEGNGLFNKDTADFETLMEEKDELAATNTPYLFYKESILGKHYYLSYIRIYSDSINNVIGHVVIDLNLKKQVSATLYPELLQTTENKATTKKNEYAYAVYINDKLIAQVNDYPFATTLKNDTLKTEHFEFYNHNGASELYYKIADKRTIVVVDYHSLVFDIITLFSYLFGVQVTLAIFILLYQLYITYFTRGLFSGRLIRLTLRRRVHFSMLSVVLVSFLLIGTVTIWFFSDQYRTSNAAKLQSAMQVSKKSVEDYLKREHAFDSEIAFNRVSQSAAFKEFITNLANGQLIDINIFDDRGILFNTSEDEIYNKGLISRVMKPHAFFQLNNLGKSLTIENERIAGLSYLSAYEPIRDDEGVTLGYINVPFFSSEKELNYQISNIVVTLINIYAFIFLFSSLITVIITRWITRTFNIIIEQFGRINLQQNERIIWPYDDEIGVLVTEYNKMVNKVEENAALLAQSERESAWREMARQVAHEIKNPLTPMKLNIQYLQQAMRNDNPNIKDLTNRVSDSIIEQIDNLSYIASEFSNFAKMPEARAEELELNNLMNKAVELYMDDEKIKVTLNESGNNLFALSDRSQLLRVFTNLLENAKQAIPDTRAGYIEASLRNSEGFAIISITDNGAGISEDVAKKIFQPYFTTKSSGTGLGLAMTKKIIEFWKGEIWFESVETVGTTFYIRLPLLKK